jgi:type III restriction enzyme
MDVIPNPWQATRILLETIDALKGKKISEEEIYNGRLTLIENMKRHLKETVHKMSEKIFMDKLGSGEIVFRLITNGNEKLNFEIAHELKMMARQLAQEFSACLESGAEIMCFDSILNFL